MTEISRIYLDHNACTPVDPRVLACFVDAERRAPGNPGSLHASGRAARAVMDEAREKTAHVLQCKPHEIVFVSNGTEANNLVIAGMGDRSLPVLCGVTEHPSVLRCAEHRGLVDLPVNEVGMLCPEQAPDTPCGLLAAVHGQSEVGTIQPVAALSASARARDVPFHLDASQTLGRIDLDEVWPLADSMTLSPHKAGGLRGSAVLVLRGGAEAALADGRIVHQLLGGGQEFGLRAGTESPALALTNALAIELAVIEAPHRMRRMRTHTNTLREALEALDGVRVLTPQSEADSLPNTLMAHFDGVDGRMLLPALDVAGVEASQGSACSSGSPTPPAILRAMGLNADAARACVRFSVSQHTRSEDIQDAGARVHAVWSTLRTR